jgi:hypothetical protein
MDTHAGAARDPQDVYRMRRETRRAEHRRHERRDVHFSVLRGAAAVLAIVAWAAFGLAGVAAGAILFLALVVAHEATVRARDRAARRVRYYETGLERLDGTWAGRGEPGARFLDTAHAYAADLDLFGRGSLFERLCSARTRGGEATLAAWLLAPATIDVIGARQAAVAELQPRVELREDLAVLGGEAQRGVDSLSLHSWLSAPVTRAPTALRAAAAAASLAALAALALWATGEASIRPLLAAAIAAGAVSGAARRFTRPVLHGVERPSRDLDTLTALLARLETERFESPLLARLRAFFGDGDERASRRVAHLQRLISLYESRRNILFAPLAYLLVWDLHVAAAIERWRGAAGPRLAGALHALAELEALCALAAYAFECPDDPFPELTDDRARFEAEGLTHPLLPLARAVRNDVRLDAERRLLVVSGSNMSGKSTFLRTIGINAVLAHAGAPVRARALRLSPLAVGASIRIQDSLQEGQSRFYAEITRVRQVMDLAQGPTGLLFLLDEIFHGTNSADRRVGAEAVVRALVQHGAIGLVTSHDLALADVADALAPQAANVHFEDHLEGGRIAFDYRLKPGRVQKSNALALMRAVGLDV